MVEEEWKGLIEGLQGEIENLKREVSNLQATIHKLHWGDNGLRSLVQNIGYLDKTLEDLTKAIRSKRK